MTLTVNRDARATPARTYSHGHQTACVAILTFRCQPLEAGHHACSPHSPPRDTGLDHDALSSPCPEDAPIDSPDAMAAAGAAEAACLAALRDLDLLDTPESESYDRIDEAEAGPWRATGAGAPERRRRRRRAR